MIEFMQIRLSLPHHIWDSNKNLVGIHLSQIHEWTSQTSRTIRSARLSDVSETPVMVCLTFERDMCKDYSCRHRRPGPHYTLTIRSQINRWPWGRGTGTPTACHAGPPPTGWSPHPSSDVRGTVAETPLGNFTDGILYLNASHMVL